LHAAIQPAPVVKRFNGYKTLGELFCASQQDALKFTIVEQIWQIIIEVVAELSEIFSVAAEWLMEDLFYENEKFTKYLKPYRKQGNSSLRKLNQKLKMQ
jgi:hypothetical protein